MVGFTELLKIVYSDDSNEPQNSMKGESDQDSDTEETRIYDLRVATAEIVRNAVIQCIPKIVALLSSENDEARTEVNDVLCTIAKKGEQS